MDDEVDGIEDEDLRIRRNERQIKKGLKSDEQRQEQQYGSYNNMGSVSPHKTTDTSAGIHNAGINLYSALKSKAAQKIIQTAGDTSNSRKASQIKRKSPSSKMQSPIFYKPAVKKQFSQIVSKKLKASPKNAKSISDSQSHKSGGGLDRDNLYMARGNMTTKNSNKPITKFTFGLGIANKRLNTLTRKPQNSSALKPKRNDHYLTILEPKKDVIRGTANSNAISKLSYRIDNIQDQKVITPKQKMPNYSFLLNSKKNFHPRADANKFR